MKQSCLIVVKQNKHHSNKSSGVLLSCDWNCPGLSIVLGQGRDLEGKEREPPPHPPLLDRASAGEKPC